MISLVIPCLNEEDNIGVLLKDIHRQNLGDKVEVIVVDGKSEDKTQAIVNSFRKYISRLKLVISDVRNVSYQRNLGAENSANEILLFLDADVQLPLHFLRNNIREFKRKKLDGAGCRIKPVSKNILDILYFKFFNLFLRIMQRIDPHMTGFCIFSKNSVHQKLKGFDSTIKVAEDMDYVRRLSRIGKFRILMSEKIHCSVRRFEAEGRFNLAVKYVRCFFYRLFFGEIRTDKFNYQFAHYKKK